MARRVIEIVKEELRDEDIARRANLRDVASCFGDDPADLLKLLEEGKFASLRDKLMVYKGSDRLRNLSDRSLNNMVNGLLGYTKRYAPHSPVEEIERRTKRSPKQRYVRSPPHKRQPVFVIR